MKPSTGRRALVAMALSGFAGLAAGIQVDITNKDSIKQAASTVAYDMMAYYQGNQSGQIPGILPGSGTPTGYYWWEGGLMFGSLIDYWHYTGDPTYNDVTTQGLLFQVGEFQNYEPINETLQLGNDDQAFWGMAALLAAETNFPNPPADQPQWLALAQAVVNRQVGRWNLDSQSCGGGLRWQFNIQQKGYSYKNAISNGCFFNMCARLGRYTTNTTFFDHADEVWDWSTEIGIIDKDWNVRDGVDIPGNCTNIHQLLFSYNAAAYLYGAAVMWNQTQNGGPGNPARADIWRQRIDSLLDRTIFNFFRNNIMTEFECEQPDNCNMDMKSYKGILARWLATTAKTAPWTYDKIYANLRPSAQAAARVCNGGDDGKHCGLKWTVNTSDGHTGIGEQMSVLEVLNSLLIDQVKAPVTANTGGTSRGDPGAGNGESAGPTIPVYKPITTGDKAGAGILTALVLGTILGGSVWMAI